MSEKTKNYYDILEIDVNSNYDEITKGYLRAKNAYSHDSLALYSLVGDQECKELLELIEEANNILSDPYKRKEYDKARGINQDIAFENESSPNLSQHIIEHNLKQSTDSTGVHSMTKIVAQKRFSLEFETSVEIEKEIEQASVFTGKFLKKIREYKNVDLPRLADMTKVSKTYLKYIEEEEFEKLPAPVYVRGFVFQYAKCLKLNPELVANSFLYLMKQATND